MSLFLWSQFGIVCLLGAMSPGPSLALIIRNSINFSRISGILTSLGHGLGIGLYAFITVILLEFIKQNSETIFFVIQICGAVFLIIFGIIFIMQKNNDTEIKSHQVHSSSFAQGFIIAIINPKILLWFISFFSQFIVTNSTNLGKAILVLTPTIIDAAWYSIVAILITGYALKEKLNKRKSILQKIIGILLICIALSLISNLIRSDRFQLIQIYFNR